MECMHHLFKILVSFNMVSELQGYSNGNVAQACGSMLPDHGGYNPQTSDPPYVVTFKKRNSLGDPVTVTLKSTDSRTFMGFMLQARNGSLDGDGPAIGKFIELDSGNIKLLTCDGLPASAVSQSRNSDKTSISVNWTAQGLENDVIIFRVTVLEKYAVFWKSVHYVTTITSPPSSSSPTTSTTSSSATTPPSTNSTTTPVPPPCKFRKNEMFGLMMMSLENLVEGGTWTGAQCFSRSKCHLNTDLMIFCSATCAVLAMLSMGFFLMLQPFTVTLVALQIVVTVIILIELILSLLSLGSSHELKEICGLDHKVVPIIHRVFTFGVILVGVVDCIYLCGENRRIYGLLIVLILYTVWICLNEIWVSELKVRIRQELQKNGKESSEGSQPESQGITERLCAIKTDVLVAEIFVIGNLLFTAAVIAGLSQCNKR